jgi:hypothetical protein
MFGFAVNAQKRRGAEFLEACSLGWPSRHPDLPKNGRIGDFAVNAMEGGRKRVPGNYGQHSAVSQSKDDTPKTTEDLHDSRPESPERATDRIAVQ